MLRRLIGSASGKATNVRILQSTEEPLACRPIFLIGVFRSGTTLLRNVMDSHSRIACPPESRFLIPLSELVNTPRYAQALASLGFEREHVKSRTRHFAAYFFENYARSRGKPRWADKTPRYVEHLEFVSELFPEAQYVIIHRHGLDVANSLAGWWVGGKGTFLGNHVAEADGDPRVGAALYWKENVGRILAFVGQRSACCYSLRYEDLCAAPEDVLRPMFEFLDEPWEPAVLEYHRFPHDSGFGDSRAKRESGFNAVIGSHQEWPEDVRARAYAAVGPTLRRLAYAEAPLG